MDDNLKRPKKKWTGPIKSIFILKKKIRKFLNAKRFKVNDKDVLIRFRFGLYTVY